MYRGNTSKFEPRNVDKYVGDSSNIICRSSWERAACYKFDENANIEYWGSEEVVVKYISPVDGRVHRYFIDFIIKFKDGPVTLIEVKPHAQTIQPKEPKRKTAKAMKRYQTEIKTWLVNQAKWRAAREVAKNNNAVFEVFTEHHLRKLGCPI